MVSEMKAEFFSPNEDVILQNEAPTDFYIIVNGSADLRQSKNGVEQIVGVAKKGDICGEIGVLCYRPQLYTVRTKRLCQLLRINRTTFLNIVQANVGDGNIIMNNLLQHLKDQKNEITKDSLGEIEQMIGRGKLDLPLSLCFAAVRRDHSLMHRLLKQGVNPNESEDGGRTALHLAASNGSEKCVRLLLEYGADPDCRDQEGSIPLWEAMRGGHDAVVKLLREYGASIGAGDIGHYACIAAEHNNLDLLKKIAQCGGNLTLPTLIPKFNGGTALHVAVGEGNLEIVKYLIDRGADIDKPDIQGWTPRDLAEQQGHEDITALFQSKLGPKPQSMVTIPEEHNKVRFLGRFTSEPALSHLGQDQYLTLSTDHGSVTGSPMRRRRKVNNFRNSLFGVISAAHKGERDPFPTVDRRGFGRDDDMIVEQQRRVIVSFHGEGTVVRKVVPLPNSLEELLEVAATKFGFCPIGVRTECGAEIDSIELIRDGDHLVLIKD